MPLNESKLKEFASAECQMSKAHETMKLWLSFTIPGFKWWSLDGTKLQSLHTIQYSHYLNFIAHIFVTFALNFETLSIQFEFIWNIWTHCEQFQWTTKQ